MVFDVVFTLGDLTVVYLQTNGGPMNATDTLPTLAFRTGILGGDLARGAATALVLFPILLVAIVAILRTLRRREV
jgi:multiple sugar transport system permease protein